MIVLVTTNRLMMVKVKALIMNLFASLSYIGKKTIIRVDSRRVTAVNQHISVSEKLFAYPTRLNAHLDLEL